jgi:hypothetical protein
MPYENESVYIPRWRGKHFSIRKFPKGGGKNVPLNCLTIRFPELQTLDNDLQFFDEYSGQLENTSDNAVKLKN